MNIKGALIGAGVGLGIIGLTLGITALAVFASPWIVVCGVFVLVVILFAAIGATVLD